MRVLNKLLKEEVGIPGVDNWRESTIRLIETEIGLSPITSEEGSSRITFPINDSDAFSSVYSKINKSTEFNYIENESYYDNDNLSLVYEFTGGKLTLEAKLDSDSYLMEVTR